jgi:hypothetical protein
MNCPTCGTERVFLITPDYGRGSEWACYQCNVYGARFISNSPEGTKSAAYARAGVDIQTILKSGKIPT